MVDHARYYIVFYYNHTLVFNGKIVSDAWWIALDELFHLFAIKGELLLRYVSATML
jgi:hypothetical protein